MGWTAKCRLPSAGGTAWRTALKLMRAAIRERALRARAKTAKAVTIRQDQSSWTGLQIVGGTQCRKK